MKARKHLWLPGTENMLNKLVLMLYGPHRCSRIHMSYSTGSNEVF